MNAITWKLPAGRFSKAEPERCHLMVASAVSLEGDRDPFPATHLVAACAATDERPILLAELREGRRHAGIYSTAVSRAVVDLVGGRFPELKPVTRGPVCHLSLPADAQRSAPIVAELPAILPDGGLCIVLTSPDGLRALVEDDRLDIDSALLVADLSQERALTALVCEDLSRRGIRCRVWKRELSGVEVWTARSGMKGGGRGTVAARRLLAGLGVGEA